MQRLIDANKLENEINQFDYYDQVKDAPTVLTIPENPTNGDMQQAILPKYWKWGTNGDIVHVWGDGQTMTFTLDWWIAPYKNTKGE